MNWYSPKHVERILKIRSNHKHFVHLVGLCTYCKMMHGAYSFKQISFNSCSQNGPEVMHYGCRRCLCSTVYLALYLGRQIFFSGLVTAASRLNTGLKLIFILCYDSSLPATWPLQGGLRLTQLNLRVWQLKLHFVLSNCFYVHRLKLPFRTPSKIAIQNTG